MPAHIVQPGDTLSSIAARFKVPLDAVIRLNQGTLRSKDPNRIFPGEAITVPLSPAGYAKAIQQLESLREELRRDFARHRREAEQTERDFQRTGRIVDFASSILMIAKGATKAALTYGGVVRRAALRKSTFDALQTTTVALYGEANPTESEKQLVKQTGAVAADQYLRLVEGVGKVDPRRAGTTAAKGLTKDAAAALVKASVPADQASDTAFAVSYVLNTILDGTQKAFESIEPSYVARQWMRFVSDGEDPERTIRRGLEMIDKAAKVSDTRVRDAITRLQDEQARAYVPQAPSTSLRPRPRL